MLLVEKKLDCICAGEKSKKEDFYYTKTILFRLAIFDVCLAPMYAVSKFHNREAVSKEIETSFLTANLYIPTIAATCDFIDYLKGENESSLTSLTK